MDPDVADDERDPLERLTAEFLGRRRSGEGVDLESFAAEHPAHADGIRALFPTLLQLERSRSPEPARSRDRFGRWRVVRELGRGGMGVVYLAEDEATGARAALKMMSAESPEAVARFRREAQAVARVAHPGLCRVLEVAPEGGALWIALEYVEGETLADALRRERRARDEGGARGSSRERDTDAWLAIGEQVAEALHAAHEAGLVHRDVKPANIMLAADGRAVVLDFGLAHGDPSGEQTRITHTGVPVGTPAYMSPEQVRAGSAPLDRRTDVYSLGATLYEALTLEAPFAAPTIAALFSQILTAEPEPVRRRNPALPRDLEVVLSTALAKQPHRRYATARHLAEDLGRVRRRERVRARPAGPARRLGLWAVRNPRLAAGVGSVALALVTGLVVALVLLARVGEARDREAATARHARARALASASTEAGRNDAMLALLLAREAVRAERTPETVTQLHAAVHGSLERVRLAGHGGPVTSLSWDAGGTTLATGSRDGRARVFDADGTLRLVVPAATEPARGAMQVALAPSGKRLVTREPDGTARLWREDGVELAQLADAVEPASAVCFLADGTAAVVGMRGRLALYEPDGALRVAWEVPLDDRRSTQAIPFIVTDADPVLLHVMTRDLRALSYDPQGREILRREEARGAPDTTLFDRGRLAVAEARGVSGTGSPLNESRDDLVLTVLTTDGKPAGTLRGVFGGETLLRGGDSWWCVWSADDGATLVDRIGTRVVVRVLDIQRGERPRALSASADGSRLFTARELPDGLYPASFATDAMRLWTASAAPLGVVTAEGDVVITAELSADGRLLALGRHSGGSVTVHVTAPVELATAVPRWREGAGFRHGVTLTSDGRHMVAFADERRLRVLREDGSERATVAVGTPETGGVRGLDLLQEHDLLLVTGQSGDVTTYDLDGRVRFRLPAQPPVLRAVWLGTEGAFVTVVAGPRVRFHAKDGTVLTEKAGDLLAPDPLRGSIVEAAVYEAHSVRVCGADGVVRRTIELGAGQETTWYHGSPAGPAVLVSHPTEFTGPLGTCRYLDAAGRSRWEAPVGGVGSRVAVISGDGDRVAIVASGGISLRDGSGREVAPLRLAGGIATLAFDSEGALLAASSMTGTVRIWDRQGRERFTLPDQGGPSQVGFSRDGRRIATVTSTMARLFTTDVDELEALAARRTTRDFSVVERARFAEILAGGR